MRSTERQAGFTIVEVLVATLILVIGALATFGLLSSATKNTQRAKATQVALDLAQNELEKLHSLKDEELALTAAPAGSEDKLNPGYRVSSDTFALVREPASEYKKLVVDGGELYGKSGEEGTIKGGVVSPGPTSFTSGDVTGKVYRYVVWQNDTSCSEANCPGPQDYKQIIVAVKLDTPPNQPAERGYVEVQSDFINPTSFSGTNPVSGQHGVVTAQQFYLTDTPCSSTPPTSRKEITGDHLLHNTLGTCANGLQNGSTKGAPDALLRGAPPDPAPEDPTVPALYDYSNDFYLEPTPDTDKGVQILRDDTSGCHYVPTGTTHPEAKVHRWVTDPMTSSFVMTGRVTIEFYTRTLNDALYTGTLCVFLFDRHETGSPPVGTDSLLTNESTGLAYWSYTPQGNGYWPRNAWTKVRLTMQFKKPPFTVASGDRLGVALSVDPANTPAEAIPIMYDHPDDPTRIEVDTNTPLEGG